MVVTGSVFHEVLCLSKIKTRSSNLDHAHSCNQMVCGISFKAINFHSKGYLRMDSCIPCMQAGGLSFRPPSSFLQVIFLFGMPF